jgi:tRNA (adenine57-N1/adenine58-N1)-methyltransferase
MINSSLQTVLTQHSTTHSSKESTTSKTDRNDIHRGQPTRGVFVRGPFVEGEKVQLTDRKGNHQTFQLVAGAVFQTNHGLVYHDEIVGHDPGCIVTTHSTSKAETDLFHQKALKNARRVGGWEFVAFRPRMVDYTLSMPRGAQIMYPKDTAQVISLGDIRNGARVLESGGGSGAMSLALLDAVGQDGELVTIERDAEFVKVAKANIELFYGFFPSWWDVRVADFDDEAPQFEDKYFDRIVLDQLDPWNRLEQAYRVLDDGGVLIAYVTTTTQMSTLAEALRESGHWTEPSISELFERSWKAVGLAVRPEHDMIGHTGFLVCSRAMGRGFEALRPRQRGTKDVYQDVDSAAAGTLESLELRDISDHKLRKVLRDLHQQTDVLHNRG